MNYVWGFGPAVVEHSSSLANIVIQVNWNCVGTDLTTGKNYKTSGMITAPTADPSNFLPFEELSAETVSGWVFEAVDQNAIEAKLLAESQVLPSVIPFRFD